VIRLVSPIFGTRAPDGGDQRHDPARDVTGDMLLKMLPLIAPPSVTPLQMRFYRRYVGRHVFGQRVLRHDKTQQ
jgi:hypothetical protein